jgi:predicted DCC family thiol-disulfide oxidoreductase YuxK
MKAQPQERSSFEPRIVAGIENGLVVFDGVCVLCSGWVQFILKRDAEGLFAFASVQGVAGSAIAEQLGIDPRDPATNAVVLDGFAYFKSDSALAVFGRLPGWRWTRILRVFPRTLRDWVYDRIARNRYALFGRTSSCMLPNSDQRSRFLDFRTE